MTLKKSIISAIVLLNTFHLIAQQEQSLHFLKNVWQSNLTNPAFVPEKKVTIMLPSIYYNVNSKDFTINELFKANAEGKLTLSDLGNRAKTQNRMDANVNIQSLGIAYNVNEKLSLSAYHAVNSNPNVNINGNLLKLIGNGNSQFLGQTLPFNSTANGSVYSEIGIGAAYKIKNHLTIGGRVKVLSGVAAIFTEGDALKVGFDKNDYSLSFENDFNVLAYSYAKFKDIKSGSDLLSQSFGGSNKGLAFDLGANINIGKISVSASIIDLAGSIKWQNDGKSYSSKGNFKYSGVNSDDFFNIDSLNSNSFRDTLKSIIGFKETANPSHTQNLPTKIYLSATYELNEKIRLGALFYNENGGFDISRTGFMVNANYKLMKNLELGGSLGLRNGSFTNIGLHAIAQLGPVQIFGVTDNIIGALQPYNSKNTNGRLGINIML